LTNPWSPPLRSTPPLKQNVPRRTPPRGHPPSSALVPSGYLLLTIPLERLLLFRPSGHTADEHCAGLVGPSESLCAENPLEAS